MTAVKICGLMDANAAGAAAVAGADYLGFVLAEGRRRMAPEAVRTILESLPAGQCAVGVFQNQPPREVAEMAAIAGVTCLQLHGDEDPAAYRFIGLPIIRAIPVTPQGAVSDVCLKHCSFGLLDTRLPGHRGGSGVPFDWAAAADRLPVIPCFLAGGLNAGNVLKAVAVLRPYAVDISSGVEVDGRKDPALIKQFIETVRRHE